MYWKLDDNMRIGLDEIDQQHQQMVDLLNQMSEAMIQDNVGQSVVQIFNQLYDYTQYHFQSEEAAHEQYGYPDRQAHAIAHQALIEKMKDLNQRFHQDNSTSPEELMDLLTDWVFGHIRGSDMRFKTYLQERKQVESTTN